MKKKNIITTSLILAMFALCIDSAFADTGTSSTSKSTSTTESSSKDVNYTGVYKDYQIIPNTMAIYCQVNAEDVLKEPAKLEECFAKIIKKMNSHEAEKRVQGKEEYDAIKFDLIKFMAGEGVQKTAASVNEENVQQQTAEQGEKSATEHEDLMFSAKITDEQIYAMRQIVYLYAKEIFFLAYDDLNSMDIDNISDVVESDADGDSSSQNTSSKEKQIGEATITNIQFDSSKEYTEDDPYVKSIECDENSCVCVSCTGKGENYASLSCTNKVCNDGTYTTSDKSYTCSGGKCTTEESTTDNGSTSETKTSDNSATQNGSGTDSTTTNTQAASGSGTSSSDGKSGNKGNTVKEMTVDEIDKMFGNGNKNSGNSTTKSGDSSTNQGGSGNKTESATKEVSANKLFNLFGGGSGKK